MEAQFIVARILSNKELIITSADGSRVDEQLHEKDSVEILGDDDPITDPTTGKTIDLMPTVKDTLVVSSVMERFALCKTQIIHLNGGFASMTENIAALYGQQTIEQQMEVDPSQLEPLGNKNDPIKKGDRVRIKEKPKSEPIAEITAL